MVLKGSPIRLVLFCALCSYASIVLSDMTQEVVLRYLTKRYLWTQRTSFSLLLGGMSLT